MNSNYLCLVLLQVPKCFVLVQIFCARPKIYLDIVTVTNILCQTKRWFAFSKIGFCAGSKVFEKALNAVKFLGWLKTFGQAQNILGPVKGQGIIVIKSILYLMCLSTSSKSSRVVEINQLFHFFIVQFLTNYLIFCGTQK